jgi:flagellar motor protein MotB
LNGLASGLMAAMLTGCIPSPYDQNLVEQQDREVIALQERNRMLKEQLVTCSQNGTPHVFYTEMVEVFSGTEVMVDRSGPNTVLVVPGSMLFSSGRTTIRQEAMMVLDLLSIGLRIHPDLHVWVIGHTDDSPLSSSSLRRKYGSNWELSAHRAAAFMHVMVKDFELPPERFTIGGRGPVHPMVANDTPEGRSLNRRLVIVVGPPDEWR